LLFYELFDQPKYFAWICVSSDLEFGVYQLIVDGDLVTASIGWEECNALDLRLDVIKQFIYQAHGPVVVVSDRAIGDGNF
jgi:hypothetical protein